MTDVELSARQHGRVVVEAQFGQVDHGKHASILVGSREQTRTAMAGVLRHRGAGHALGDVMAVVIVQFIGVGTVVNVVAVLIGSGIGMLLGDRFNERTRSTVTDVLGLLTLVIAGTSIVPLAAEPLRSAVGSAGLVVIMVSMLIGTLIGSALKLEDRVTQLGAWLRRSLVRGDRGADEENAQLRFIDGFVTASLVFCIGPMAILGSLNDGLGRGAEQLYLKSVLDLFAAMAFAASFGAGVAASILVVAILQGGLTLVGWALGDVLPTAQIDALTVAGGVILGGLALRLLSIKQIRIADMLPGIVIAPIAVGLVQQVI